MSFNENMSIDRYEIDMLDVKNADAFLIHFFTTEGFEYVVLIDGGNYSDGERITQFIHDNYTQQYIDLAICTHCDKDHFGGIMYLLEQMRDNVKDHVEINKVWIHDPALHVKLGQVRWITKKQTLIVKARSVYDLNGDNLWDVLDELIAKNKIQWTEPFSNPINSKQESGWLGVLSVVGPTREYYASLVPDFRNDLQRKEGGYKYEEPEDIDITEADETLNKRLDEAIDDPSSHNKSSVMVLFKPNAFKKYLFAGDACRESFDKLKGTPLYNSLSHLTWLKVPHHGSIHNLDSTLIQHLHPLTAYISTEKYNHYLSRSVVTALKKIGTDVFATNIHGSMTHMHNTPLHKGYSYTDPM